MRACLQAARQPFLKSRHLSTSSSSPFEKYFSAPGSARPYLKPQSLMVRQLKLSSSAGKAFEPCSLDFHWISSSQSSGSVKLSSRSVPHRRQAFLSYIKTQGQRRIISSSIGAYQQFASSVSSTDWVRCLAAHCTSRWNVQHGLQSQHHLFTAAISYEEENSSCDCRAT